MRNTRKAPDSFWNCTLDKILLSNVIQSEAKDLENIHYAIEILPPSGRLNDKTPFVKMLNVKLHENDNTHHILIGYSFFLTNHFSSNVCITSYQFGM